MKCEDHYILQRRTLFSYEGLNEAIVNKEGNEEHFFFVIEDTKQTFESIRKS